MTLALEDFGGFAGLTRMTSVDPERLEAEKLESFDKGYAAGWDDATEAAERSAQSSGQAVRARLEELSFTYHEARAHVMQALGPLLEAVASTALPQLVRQSLGQRLIEVVEDLAQDAADAPVTVHVPPADLDAVAGALGDTARFPYRLEADDELAPDTIHVRLGDQGRLIDTQAAAARLTEALAALDTLNKETLSHG